MRANGEAGRAMNQSPVTKHKRWKFWVGGFLLVSAGSSSLSRLLNGHVFGLGDIVTLAVFVPWGAYWVLKNSNAGYALGIYAKPEQEQDTKE
jgi:hypothetical protein